MARHSEGSAAWSARCVGGCSVPSRGAGVLGWLVRLGGRSMPHGSISRATGQAWATRARRRDRRAAGHGRRVARGWWVTVRVPFCRVGCWLPRLVVGSSSGRFGVAVRGVLRVSSCSFASRGLLSRLPLAASSWFVSSGWCGCRGSADASGSSPLVPRQVLVRRSGGPSRTPDRLGLEAAQLCLSCSGSGSGSFTPRPISAARTPLGYARLSSQLPTPLLGCTLW
jgi:hypothetical protein